MQVTDGALHLPAIRSILVAITPGTERCLPVGYFSMRIKNLMLNWNPCKLEAYAQAKALDEYSIYFRESDNPPICLRDNSAVVEAAKRLKRGEYLASPRLQTLITALQQYGVIFCHMP